MILQCRVEGSSVPSEAEHLKINPLTSSALLLYDEKKINCEQLICILEKIDVYIGQ